MQRSIASSSSSSIASSTISHRDIPLRVPLTSPAPNELAGWSPGWNPKQAAAGCQSVWQDTNDRVERTSLRILSKDHSIIVNRLHRDDRAYPLVMSGMLSASVARLQFCKGAVPWIIVSFPQSLLVGRRASWDVTSSTVPMHFDATKPSEAIAPSGHSRRHASQSNDPLPVPPTQHGAFPQLHSSPRLTYGTGAGRLRFGLVPDLCLGTQGHRRDRRCRSVVHRPC